MSMTTFRFLLFIKGFVHIAEGLLLILSLGFFSGAWTTRFGLWMFDMDE